MKAALAWLAAAAGLAGPAFAVGLAPLSKEGDTVGTDKAFYLTVINPYSDARTFRAYLDGETSPSIMPASAPAAVDGPPRLSIIPEAVTIKPGGQRRFLVVLRDLAPGETRTARVCAELAQQEGMIRARVCSKLSARRLARRAV